MKIKRFNEVNEDVINEEKKSYSVTIDIPNKFISIIKKMGINSEENIKTVFTKFVEDCTGSEIDGDDTFDVWLESQNDFIDDVKDDFYRSTFHADDLG